MSATLNARAVLSSTGPSGPSGSTGIEVTPMTVLEVNASFLGIVVADLNNDTYEDVIGGGGIFCDESCGPQ